MKLGPPAADSGLLLADMSRSWGQWAKEVTGTDETTRAAAKKKKEEEQARLQAAAVQELRQLLQSSEEGQLVGKQLAEGALGQRTRQAPEVGSASGALMHRRAAPSAGLRLAARGARVVMATPIVCAQPPFSHASGRAW